MKIDHIGLYVSDLDAARAFFEKYFCVTANEKYTNPKKGFAQTVLKSSTARAPLATAITKAASSALTEIL